MWTMSIPDTSIAVHCIEPPSTLPFHLFRSSAVNPPMDDDLVLHPVYS
jgi:hypothetical protein